VQSRCGPGNVQQMQTDRSCWCGADSRHKFSVCTICNANLALPTTRSRAEFLQIFVPSPSFHSRHIVFAPKAKGWQSKGNIFKAFYVKKSIHPMFPSSAELMCLAAFTNIRNIGRHLVQLWNQSTLLMDQQAVSFRDGQTVNFFRPSPVLIR